MTHQRESEQQFFITLLDVIADGDTLECKTTGAGAREYELKDRFGYILASYDGNTSTSTYA